MRGGFLRSFSLYENARYYALGPEASKLLALKPRTGKQGFGPNRTPKYAAILDHCLSVKGNLTLLKRNEFLQEFPELSEGLEGLQDRYVFELNEAGRPHRLATFVIDNRVKLTTLLTKLREVAIARDQNQAFQRLVDEDAFIVLVLTHNLDRADQIRSALGSPRTKKIRLPVEVSVCPLLERIVRDVRPNKK